MERALSIGQLASATGLAKKTIRYYEQVGVLPAPRRNAAGYRQYARGDVHRTLFIRRARALGLPLSSLKALTTDLAGRPSRALRPRLERLVTEHLRAVRDQIADCHVLEQQLEQALHRLRTMPSARASEACQCLDGSAIAMSHEPPTRERGGGDMGAQSSMEAMTRLAAASTGDCDCSCGCESRSTLPVKDRGLPLLPLRRAALAGGRYDSDPGSKGAADSGVSQR